MDAYECEEQADEDHSAGFRHRNRIIGLRSKKRVHPVFF